MNKNNKFENLKVWKLAHQLTLAVYQAAKAFPQEEKYSLTDQLRRAVSSVPTNIVEGNERKTKKEYIQFLYIAKGSLAETKYLLMLARDLKYLPINQYKNLSKSTIEISKMLSGLIKYLRR